MREEKHPKRFLRALRVHRAEGSVSSRAPRHKDGGVGCGGLVEARGGTAASTRDPTELPPPFSGVLLRPRSRGRGPGLAGADERDANPAPCHQPLCPGLGRIHRAGEQLVGRGHAVFFGVHRAAAAVVRLTLVAVNPDGVQRRLVGDVTQCFERRGFKLIRMKMLQVPEASWGAGGRGGWRASRGTSHPLTHPSPSCITQVRESVLAEHYHDLQRKPFYPALISYKSSGPMVAMVWEGHNVVHTSRAMIEDTDAAEAAPGTIRGDFGIHISRNIIYTSDSVERAQREIGLWFQSSELVDWLDRSPHSSILPA
ncbi:nucleoside diphosphate kinase, mitochondrial [Loxodonta africana]|uniref:nucleoside diphosphate kinase, mitochondrial n=1 Tax=Loxodonta africana TaxID=9785 RepID=UPI000C811A00|nr:nucleoside diphosphate kinase, mitochondrial [Loxodonta africana]